MTQLKLQSDDNVVFRAKPYPIIRQKEDIGKDGNLKDMLVISRNYKSTILQILSFTISFFRLMMGWAWHWLWAMA